MIVARYLNAKLFPGSIKTYEILSLYIGLVFLSIFMLV